MHRIIGFSVVIVILMIFVPYTETAKSKQKNNTSSLVFGEEYIKNVEEILGTTAEIIPSEKVLKVSFPRKDIIVTVDHYHLDPFLGLTSWVSFQPDGKRATDAMAMGDIVLLEHEVNPVMTVALDHNIAVTALHNHFIFDQPKVYFMHIEGNGNIIELASILKKMLDAQLTTKSSDQQSVNNYENKITGSIIENILGVKGQEKSGMFKVVIGRKIRAGCGCIVGKSMGINTWAGFGGTDDKAIVDGDFAVREDELQDVLKALVSERINIVAIHNHMIFENPRMIFVHYWGRGTVQELAQALKKALNKTKVYRRI